MNEIIFKRAENKSSADCPITLKCNLNIQLKNLCICFNNISRNLSQTQDQFNMQTNLFFPTIASRISPIDNYYTRGTP